MEDCPTDGILFHSFIGDRILFVDELEEVETENFTISLSIRTEDSQTKETYSNSFSELKNEIAKGEYKKVILSRTKIVTTTKKAIHIFELLNQKYDSTFNYIISNKEIGTWIGASPERLLSISKKKIETMSLAGTKMPKDNWEEKEYEEQKLVTDTILNVLNKTNCHSIIKDGPSTLNAGKIQHLHTKINAELDTETDWKIVLKQLHPTPAVCGIPTSKAQNYIPILEKHARNFYTGYIGVVKENKKDFFVNLRCMELFDTTAKLYLGGGITAPSELEAEWIETEKKSRTLMDVLQ